MWCTKKCWTDNRMIIIEQHYGFLTVLVIVNSFFCKMLIVLLNHKSSSQKHFVPWTLQVPFFQMKSRVLHKVSMWDLCQHTILYITQNVTEPIFWVIKSYQVTRAIKLVSVIESNFGYEESIIFEIMIVSESFQIVLCIL